MRSMSDKKFRWKLQIFWSGEWRTIMESDTRKILAEYAGQCNKDLELRIIDAEEEVKPRGRRH